MNTPSTAAAEAKDGIIREDGDCPKDGYLISKNDKNGIIFQIRAYCLGHEPYNTNE